MISIGERKLGKDYPPLIIAEIGINHGGDLEVAKKMVLAAAQSGCECVKHQTHFVEDEMTDEAKSIFPPNADMSIWDVIDQCSLSRDDEIALKAYAESLGMIYISTPFSRNAADFLHEIGVPGYKIGSGECDNLMLIEHIAGKGLPVIMSTGMQSLDSIRPSVETLLAANIPLVLLECTNLYPSPPNIVSLRGVTELKQAFPQVEVGFSDHSMGPYMAMSSIALGACVVERHFTDSRYREGPDISASMDPSELRLLIERSKEIWIAANNEKKRTSKEEAVYKFARSSVVADRDLKAGQILEMADIWARRPGNGEIPGYDYKKVLGKKLLVDVAKNTQLHWTDLSDA